MLRSISGGVWARLDSTGSWHLSNDDGTSTDYAVKKGVGLNEWDLIDFGTGEALETFNNFLDAAKAGNRKHNEAVTKWRKAQEAKTLNSLKGDYDEG